jgi:spermidine synthase
MLFLDNEIQLAELDEFIYHELFSFPALFMHPNPRKILIIGGGDLFLAKQILKLAEIELIDLIELDTYVVKFCLKHFKHLLGNIHNHPKLNIKIQDGYQFIKETTNHYDIIYVDLPDNKKNCKFAFEDNFYKDIKTILYPNGILSAQTGNGDSFYYSQRTKKIRKILSMENPKNFIEYFKLFTRYFNYHFQYREFIPSFFGQWSFTLGSDIIDFRNANHEKIRNRYHKINKNSLYYSPEYHKSLYSQPKIIDNVISRINK